MANFSGKKAIVLGGTSGIGLAATEMLRDAGAEVIAGGRRECDIDGIECVQVDVQDRDALAALFEKHHGFDFLVNAATGGPRAIGPLLEMDLDGFQNSFAKLWGYVNSVRLGVPHEVEPVTCPTLSIVGRIEQSGDQLFISLWIRVLDEPVDFFRCGRKPDQVEIETANQGSPIRFRGRRQPLPALCGEDKRVNRRAYPGGIGLVQPGQGRACERCK